MSKPSMQAELPKVDRVWLCVSNVCERGKFKVSLEINSEHLMDLFYSYPDQNDGVVSQATNLTWMLKSSTAYDALLAENEILKSKASQFESTIAETMRMRDAYLAQAEAMAEVLSHAKAIGRLGEGSTLGWANEALENWQKFKEQK